MPADLKSLVEKLNPTCRGALEGAAALCVKQTHYTVELEHLLMKLVEADGTDVQVILRQYELNPSTVAAELTQGMERLRRGNSRSTPALSPHLSRLIEQAWMIASLRLGEGVVRSGAVIAALVEDESLRGLLLDASMTLLRLPRERLDADLPTLLAASDEAFDRRRAEGIALGTPRLPAGGRNDRRTIGGSTRPKGPPTPHLDQYTIDLTALAADGRLDPARGRDAEIRQVVDILLRRRQNNPILTGEAGVGKTAVVEGFALRIHHGEVPPALRDASVHTLDLGLLQAGAGVRGEFENRLRGVIDEVKGSPRPVILFIDEAHTLIGAGGSEGHGDAANLLKPALARGELRTIAATTWGEYKRYFEKDPALTRRFQVVKVDEPSEAAAVDMLRGVVPQLERHHGVRVLDEAVRDAVALSHRYISERRLPDKAVSVLDTACARVAAAQTGPPPSVEDARRRVETLESERSALHRETLAGRGDHARGTELAQDLVPARMRLAEVDERWQEELAAVREIRTVQASLEEAAASGNAALAPGGEAERLAQVLARLERGLEVIQADEPMVPVHVDSRVVAQVVSGWTGIPVGKMLTDEIHAVLMLRERLGERIVGQPEALDAIARRIRTVRAELDDPGKPVGVFLLCGPSGVGKTETAYALADLLYGGERNLITINMSEYQEAHTVSSLRGAPPGYVGYGRGGVLTEAVRRRPYAVVLLDEIEKAHPDVLELFYQVFDKGQMEDGEGAGVDFRNTVLLLTSNLGAELTVDACRAASRPDAEAIALTLRPELLRHFKPALLARMTVVPFLPLGDAEIRSVVRLKLARVQRRFQDSHGAPLSFDDALVEAIARRCTEVDSGARNVDHIVTQTLLPELSARVLDCLARGESVGPMHVGLDRLGDFSYHLAPAEAYA